MAAEWDSDGSSLDPSDIIERYVDSDASDLSQSPPAIHDLSAEVARLLHHHSTTSSPSEESDDARSPKRGPAVRRRRRRGLQGDVPFDVESATSSGANSRSNPEVAAGGRQHAPAEDHHRISRGGAKEPTHLALPMAIQRLQSTGSIRSLVAGSPQGSVRSSLSQLSDEFPAKPLAEELEEADKQEKLRKEAALFDNFDSDSSSVVYSSEEESGEEGSLLAEEIDFELHDEEDPPPQMSTEHKVPSWTSQSEQRALQQSVAGRIEIHKEPQDPPKESEAIGITAQKDPSSTNPAKTTPQSPNTPIDQNASTFGEMSSDQVDNEAQHSQRRTLTPPLVDSIDTKQLAREVSRALENLQQGQTSKLAGPSAQAEPEKPDPRTQRKSSGEGISKHTVRVKRFSRQKKPVTPPPSRTARKSSAESQQEDTLLQHSPVKREETRTLTDRLIPEPRREDLLYTDSEDSSSSSESEETAVSATPSPFTATRREHDTLSEALLNARVNKPILDSQEKCSEHHKPHAFPSVASSEPEPTSGLKPAIVQQPGHSPLLKIMSSPSLPLKGILKKPRFESTTSTSTDLTTVTPMCSKASSCSSLDTAVEISSTLVHGTPSMVSEQRPMLSQLGRARSSPRSSGDLERTLTNEQTHSAVIDRQPMVPCFDQPAYTDSEDTLVTTSGDESSLHWDGVIGEEAFKKSLKTQMHKMPLTSSPLTACRNLANHPLSRKQASPPATTSTNANRKNTNHQTTQLKSDGRALDSAYNAVQTPATDDLREKVSNY